MQNFVSKFKLDNEPRKVNSRNVSCPSLFQINAKWTKWQWFILTIHVKYSITLKTIAKHDEYGNCCIPIEIHSNISMRLIWQKRSFFKSIDIHFYIQLPFSLFDSAFTVVCLGQHRKNADKSLVKNTHFYVRGRRIYT